MNSIINKFNLLIAFLMLCCINAVASEANKLYIPDVKAYRGKAMSLPVYMNNTSEITAVQFTVVTPFQFKIETSSIKLSDRNVDHKVIIREISDCNYKVMIYSPQNAIIQGNSGQLIFLDMTVPTTVVEDETYSLTLKDVVLSINDGTNVVTEFSTGAISIAKSPDLIVSDVKTDKTTYTPGSTINVSWNVKNIGARATEGGWKEQIYLANAEISKLLGSVYYESTLLADAGMTRQASIILPDIIGIDGQATIMVKIVPNSDAGEGPESAGNNTSNSSIITIARKLVLSLPDYAVDENTVAIRCKLSRSGNITSAETFTITNHNTSRITLPANVTIEKNQSGVVFYANLIDNTTLDIDSIVTMSITSNFYPEITDTIVIEDNELAPLDLSLSTDSVIEGSNVTLTLIRESYLKNDTIYLSSDNPKQLEIPEYVVMGDGITTTTVTINAKDDDIAEHDDMITVYAYSAKYERQTTYLDLIDNDVPDIDFTIYPQSVNENSGLTAIMATITRTSNIDKNATIKLSDNSNNELYYSAKTIEMKAGLKSVEFTIGVVDNNLVDGDRTYNVVAAVYMPSCNCNANEGSRGSVERTITVLDNDGPSLQLTSASSMILEGSESDVTVKLTRNTDTTEALTVKITSDDERISVSDVIIPAGSNSVEFKVKASSNDVSGDSRTVILTAQADGFTQGVCWMQISDYTLPDAVISSISIDPSQDFLPGTDVTINLTVSNKGVVDFRHGTPVYVYANYSSTPVDTIFTKISIIPGGELAMLSTFTLPQKTGSYKIYATINPNKSISECLYVNNTSEKVSMTIYPPFSVTTSADKDIYNEGEDIIITGALEGKNVANKEVEVYVINNGYRDAFNVTTDANGIFSISYPNEYNLKGVFNVGACYPGENSKNTTDEFNIYDLRRVSSGYITCQMLTDVAYTGHLIMQNMNSVSLSNIKAEILSIPENYNIELTEIKSLAGKESAVINYTIKNSVASTGNSWEEIKLRISSSEGAHTDVIIYCFTRVKTGKLSANIAQINTTMTKGGSREYQFNITNIGMGNTGKITLLLPENVAWMKSVTPTELPALEPDSSTTVILQLCPYSDIMMNVYNTGNIALNCENGEGLSIPYRILPVSEETGNLIVEVCDEYTYGTENGPRVSGADIKLYDYATKKLIGQATTDSTGIFTFTNIPEGTYSISVTADGHDPYSNNLVVDPGTNNRHVANASIEDIKVEWTVVETEIEDEYEIVTKVDYETSVIKSAPVPVVEIIMPDSIPIDEFMAQGSYMIHALVVNKGLITAEKVSVAMKDANGIEFEYFVENGFDVPTKSSMIVPIKIKLTSSELQTTSSRNNGLPCTLGAIWDWFWDCGLNDIQKTQDLSIKFRNCRVAQQSSSRSSSNNGGGKKSSSNAGPAAPFGGGNSGGYGGYLPGVNYNNVIFVETNCDPNAMNTIKGFTDWALSNSPIFKSDPIGWKDYVDVYKAINGPGSEYIEDIEKINEFIEEICDIPKDNIEKTEKIIEAILDMLESQENQASPLSVSSLELQFVQQEYTPSRNLPSYIQEFLIRARNIVAAHIYKRLEFYEVYGHDYWQGVDEDEFNKMHVYLKKWSNQEISEETLLTYRPSAITMEQMTTFIQRLKNTVDNDYTGDNKINIENMIEYETQIKNIRNEIINEGFIDFGDYANHTIKTLWDNANSSSNNVCATISLQINQTMTMTRQAFEGTLTVFNGHETTAMQDVKLTLTVTDTIGVVSTSHEFQIDPIKLDGFSGNLNLTDGWTLNANSTGIATIQFIPTKYAALEEPTEYSFGGSLSYINPYTNEVVTRELYPVTLTVKPSPNLNMTYFMQRDILGDNPLTLDVIEPIIPGEFSLLVHNIGNGDATNVNIITNQPEIIENEKGIEIDFELLSSQVNGKEQVMALGGNVPASLGTIPAHNTSYVQWWLQSSLLGHFIKYDIEANHVTSYGNEDLSLLNEVSIHELIRSLKFPNKDNNNDSIAGFLVNDIVDAKDLPDVLYLSDGTIHNVKVVDNANVTVNKKSRTECTMIVKPEVAGWNYGKIADPFTGKATLVGIKRMSDGANISLRNMWQTEYTLNDGRDPLQDYRLHFVDSLGTNEETYILTFTPKPDPELEITKFTGIDAHVNCYSDYISSIVVNFNKEIDASTFTIEDLKLKCQGKDMDMSNTKISTSDNRNFTIQFDSLAIGEGYNVLTVSTSNIVDFEGFNGTKGKYCDWVQYLGGIVGLKTTPYPENSGITSIISENQSESYRNLSQNQNGTSSMEVEYNSDVTIIATANDGYRFKGWYNGEILISTEAIYTSSYQNHTELRAVFEPNRCKVWVESQDENQGLVTGSLSGYYDYDTHLSFSAEPNIGYKFVKWSDETTANPYSINVSNSIEIYPIFKPIIYELTYMLNGEIYSTDSIAYGTEITPISVPAKEGYTFNGWQNVPTTMPASNVLIDGYYSVNIYQVTFLLENEIYATDSVAYNSTITLPETPLKDGYIFAGWNNIPETMPAYDIEIIGTFNDISGIEEIIRKGQVDVYNLQGFKIKSQIRLDKLKEELPPRYIYIIEGYKILIK